MRNLQILMKLSKGSDDPIIKRAMGDHARTGRFRTDLVKVIKNKTNNN